MRTNEKLKDGTGERIHENSREKENSAINAKRFTKIKSLENNKRAVERERDAGKRVMMKKRNNDTQNIKKEKIKQLKK